MSYVLTSNYTTILETQEVEQVQSSDNDVRRYKRHGKCGQYCIILHDKATGQFIYKRLDCENHIACEYCRMEWKKMIYDSILYSLERYGSLYWRKITAFESKKILDAVRQERKRAKDKKEDFDFWYMRIPQGEFNVVFIASDNSLLDGVELPKDETLLMLQLERFTENLVARLRTTKSRNAEKKLDTDWECVGGIHSIVTVRQLADEFGLTIEGIKGGFTRYAKSGNGSEERVISALEDTEKWAGVSR